MGEALAVGEEADASAFGVVDEEPEVGAWRAVGVEVAQGEWQHLEASHPIPRARLNLPDAADALEMAVVDGILGGENGESCLGVLPGELGVVVVAVGDDEGRNLADVPAEGRLYCLVEGKPRLDDEGFLGVLQDVAVAGRAGPYDRERHHQMGHLRLPVPS